MMDRRTFVVAATAIAVAPGAAVAQQAGKSYRIGWLDLGAPPSATLPSLEAFRRGLSELGWIEGRNFSVETRYADDDTARLAAVTAELVAMRVDAIVTITTPAALAAKKATGLIPIVMAGSSNPVELGLVKSLARPGENVTGLTNTPAPDSCKS